MRLRKFLIGLASVLLVVNAAVAIYLYRGANADFIPERPDTSVGQPKNFRVYDQDDRAAVLTWDPPTKIASLKKDQDVTGYKVSWGKEGEELKTVQLTAYTALQMQPLENGVRYQAQIQSIDKNGKVSSPAPLLSFTGDSTRVDGLKKDFAFFDDFNRPAGQYDAKKWAFACNENVASEDCGLFINNQFHAHTAITSVHGFTDRASAGAVSRDVFDISNSRTGAVVWDQDIPGAKGRGASYITLHAANNYTNSDTVANASNYRTDLFWHQVFPRDPVRNPNENGTSLTLRMVGGGISVLATNKEGVERTVYDYQDYKNPFNPYIAYNIRLHYSMKISQKQIAISINGKQLFDVPLTNADNPNGLEATQFFAGWQDNNYNTHKADNHETLSLGHWDNFGFDGPKTTTVVTHPYTNGILSNPTTPASGYAKKNTTTVTIPDSINATDNSLPKATRLVMYPMSSIKVTNGFYKWKPTDFIKINGTAVTVPPPTHLFQSLTGGAQITPEIVMPIDPKLVKQGVNNLETFFLDDTQIEGKAPIYRRSEPYRTVIELDYDKATEPAQYTEEATIYPNLVIKPVAKNSGPVLQLALPDVTYTYCSSGAVQTRYPVVGEDAAGVLTTSDGKTNSASASKNACGGGKPFVWKVFSGIADIGGIFTPSKMLIETGANSGLARMDLYLDGKLNLAIYTNKDVPIPSLKGTTGSPIRFPLRLDTTNLCNGLHALYIGGYNGNGIWSHSDWNGDFYYINIKVNNPGQVDCPSDFSHISHTIPDFYANGLVPPADCLTATGQKADCHDHPDIVTQKVSLQLTSTIGSPRNISKTKMDIYEGNTQVKAYTDLVVDDNGILEAYTPAQVMGLSDDKSYRVVLNVPGYKERTLESVSHILTQRYALTSAERLEPLSDTRKAAISAITYKAASGNSAASYKVDFTTTNFTPISGGEHVHFYFDNESSDVRNKMFSGASPYTLASSAVVAGAKKLCIIVANADHSVAANSGNCVDMPAVSDPGNNPPPPANYSAAITGITSIGTPVATGYTVAFTTTGFTPAANATHVNFYFDNQAETVTDKVVTASSPYVLAKEAVVTGAKSLCIIVADAKNTVVSKSGNCVALPKDSPSGGGDNSKQAIQIGLTTRFNTTTETITGASVIVYDPATKAAVKTFTGLTIGAGQKLDITDATLLSGLSDTATYDIEIRVPMFLNRVVKGVTKLVSTPVTLTTDTALIPGDGNGNNQIDLSDIGILIAAYNEQLPKTHQLYKVYHGKVGLENIAQIAQLYNGPTVGDTYK